MPNATNEQRVELLLKRAIADHKEAIQRLKNNCEYLIRQLEKTVRECDLALADKPYAINSLGVVQGNGLDIDRQCANIRYLSDTVGSLEFATGKD